MAKIVARQFYASLAPTVTFDDDGIALAPLWADPVRVGWSEVECVSVTPWMERGPDGWREAWNQFREGPSILETKRLFSLDVVVRDRRRIRTRTASRLKRLWIDTWLRPMYGLDDRPEPDRSAFELTLRRDLIEGTVDELLDLVAARSRFELVVHFD